MANVSSNDGAAKWAARAQAAAGDWQSGVQAVTVSPPQLAAKSADLWLSQLQASKAKYVRNAGAVTAAEWIAQTISKGASRYPQGVAAAQGKYEQVAAKLYPYLRQANLPARGGLEANIQRAVAQMRHNANFQK